MTLTNLSDEISPFPLTGNHHHLLQNPFQQPPEFRPPLPLQKLRPVRNNQYVTEYSDFPTIIDTGLLPENEGSLIENLEYNHQVGDSGREIEVKQTQEVVFGSGFSGNESMEWMEGGEVVEKEGSGGGGGNGNRWPREETLALLKIRAEMDAQFRDVNPKSPLWEIISRKLEQMGYNRDPKKCQEKFKNIYKYYKKTKEKLPLKDEYQGGKFYKFFSELKAFDNNQNEEKNRIGETGFEENNNNNTIIQTPDPDESSVKEVGLKNSLNESLFNEYCLRYDVDDNDDDDDELEEDNVEGLSRKRKRTNDELKLYCENLVKEMMKKQEQMYQQLVDRMDKLEKDRMMREEAWKRQEMDRTKREKEMRDQEMSRNLALVSFLEKFVGQQIPIQQSPELYQEDKRDETEYKVDSNNMRWPKVEVQVEAKHEESSEYKFDSNNKRWPKAEVQALISLRTAMEEKYRSAAPKGPPLWDEISLAMSSLGYNRTPKKCKEKWENINKYFKRAAGNGKKRSGNEKTCSYFRELDIIYKNRLLNPAKTPDETNDEGKERSTKGEMLTTLAQVCNLFSMSEPLEAPGDQSGSSLVRSDDIHSNL